MSKSLIKYFFNLYNGIPTNIYLVFFAFFCIGSSIIFACYGFKNGLRKVALLLLIEYAFLLFSSTIIFRPVSHNKKVLSIPFWSYIVAHNYGSNKLIAGNILNIIVFIPVGFLLCMSFRKVKVWQVFLVGLGLSVAVEAMQYVFNRGYAEVDDVIHNTVGCLISYGIYVLVRMGWKKWRHAHNK